MAAALMAILDLSITNVVLSDIRGSFGVPLDQIGWITTSYAMAHMTIIPLSGWLQRRFGLKRYFLITLAFFTLSSVLCGISWNLESLLAFRVLQGFSGGALIPTSQTIMFSRFPLEKYGTAGALVSVCTATAPLIAPTLGGWLAEMGDWHWVFLVNVPVGVIAVYVGAITMKEPVTEREHVPLDLPGMALLPVTMVSLVYVLEEGNRSLWFESNTIIAASAVAVIGMVMFVLHELESPNPLIDLRALADRNLGMAALVYFFVGGLHAGGAFLVPLFCGAVLHYSALDIGWQSLRAFWVQIPVLFLASVLVKKVDPRWLIGLGFALLGLSMWRNAKLTSGADEWAFLVPLALGAAGVGFVNVPLTLAAYGKVHAKKRGNAAALVTMGRTLGVSIAVSLLGMQMTRRVQTNTAAMARSVMADTVAFQEQLDGLSHRLSQVADPAAAALSAIGHRIEKQALVRAFDACFVDLTIAAVVALAIVPLLSSSSATPWRPRDAIAALLRRFGR